MCIRMTLPLFRCLSLNVSLRAMGAALAVLTLLAPATAQYELVWEDDFDGDSVDLTKWEFQIGDGTSENLPPGWGNNELQYYREENATVSGGLLTITAKEEAFGGYAYTSARMRTKNLGDWEGGRFEIRARLPFGQGLWPGIWLLNTDGTYGTWAASGEIDIMELLGHEPAKIHGTTHYGGEWPAHDKTQHTYNLPTGTFNDSFHVFAVEWDEFAIRWYVDGIEYGSQHTWWSSGGDYPAPFDQRFHMLLNVAVGGDWPGSPDATTQFPQMMEVDYVRVYQEPSPGDCSPIYDAFEHADPFNNGYFYFDGPGAHGGIAPDLVDLPPVNGGSVSLSADWSGSTSPAFLGGLGRMKQTDLSEATHFEMWINIDPGTDGIIDIKLQDDDNGDGVIGDAGLGEDDEFKYELLVKPAGSGGWQHVAIPLDSFTDDNSYHWGGNGILDATPPAMGGNGELINLVMVLTTNSGTSMTFRTDHWAFTRRASLVSGTIRNDLDGDGTLDGDPGIPGVTVDLLDSALGEAVHSTVTDAGGAYLLPELLHGDFEVRVDPQTLPAGATATYDPDGIGTPNTFSLSLACDESATTQNFGYTHISLGTRYCDPATANSTGAPAQIWATGTNVVLFNSFFLTSTDLPQNQFGYYVTSATQGLIQSPGGSQGDLCLGGQMGRFNQQVQNSGGSGEFGIAVDLTNLPPPLNHAVLSGETWNFTTWYRDKNPHNTSNFTDAVSVLFQ